MFISMMSDLFGNVIVIVLQSIFHLKKYQYNIYFYFLKIIFDIIKKHKKILI